MAEHNVSICEVRASVRVVRPELQGKKEDLTGTMKHSAPKEEIEPCQKRFWDIYVRQPHRKSTGKKQGNSEDYLEVDVWATLKCTIL